MLRGVLLLLIILLFVNLFRKTDSQMGTIARFKLQTFNKIKSDSSSAKHKLDQLVSETEKFSKQLDAESPSIKNAALYLIGSVILFIIVELGFFMAGRRGLDR